MTEDRALTIYQVPDVLKLGEILARSGYFQDAKDAGQAVVKVLAGQELGFGPIASMTGIYIVKGRVSLSANLIAAAIKRSGRYDYRVLRLDNTGCEIEWYEHGKAVGKTSFTDDDAKAAGLDGDNWRKYRRNMHFARNISNGGKWYCPDVFNGPVYTPDELGEIVDGETGEVIDVTPTPVATPKAAPTPQPEPVAVKPAGVSNRPYDAETCRAFVRSKSKVWLAENPARRDSWQTAKRDESALQPWTGKQVEQVAALMGKACDGDDQARHAVLNYLLGITTTTQISRQEANAIVALWAADNENGWTTNDFAAAEANAILMAVLVEAGQQALPL
jgi:hypothetical protein